ncbi:MAG: phospholipase [Bacteroidales bacterium]|nr:phospholipase [Bacteroidales bacterium]
MIVSLIILGSLLGLGAICYAHYRLSGADGRNEKADDRSEKTADIQVEAAGTADSGEVCCGQHIVCERGLMSAATSATPEYFDDEELDVYSGRPADSYTGAETEQFRDVLVTLRSDEVIAWAHSIQQRGINLPTEVRDELMMLVAESRGI